MRKLMSENSGQRGAALPLALLALLFLTLLGFMAMSTASIEVRLSGNERDSQQAVYAAEAAVAHMRARLKQRLIDAGKLDDWSVILRGPEACNPTSAGDLLATRGIRGRIAGFDYDVCVYDDLDENIGVCSTRIVELANPADASLFKENTFEHAHLVTPPGEDPTYDPNEKIYICAAAISRVTGTRSALEVLVEPGGIIMAATDSRTQLGGGGYKTFSGNDKDAVDEAAPIKDIGSL